jgi:hypothetical protein
MKKYKATCIGEPGVTCMTGNFVADDGRYIDSTEVVNGHTIGEWVEMIERDEVLTLEQIRNTANPAWDKLMRLTGYVKRGVKG